MTQKDLEHIDRLIQRYNDLPKVVELRVKIKWQIISEDERNILYKTYKDLDDLLNDTLAFINVKFPNRKDLTSSWNKIDFDTKIGEFKITTNSPELIRSNWIEGMLAFENLLKTLRREITLLLDNPNPTFTSDKPTTIIEDSTVVTTNVKDLKLRTGSKTNNSQKFESKNSKKQYYINAAGLVIAAIGLIFGDNLIKHFIEPSANTSYQSIEDDNSRTTILADSTEIPYLSSIPILDKGLFLKYDYNYLRIGGANIEGVLLNCRKQNGEELKFSREEKSIVMSISEEPYIELSYKGHFYSITVFGQHYNFKYSLKSIHNPTLELLKP